MERTPLPPAAEKIRNEIREMIPETATLTDQPVKAQAELLHKDENGNKIYGGNLFTEKAARLKQHMEIDQNWTERLVYWSKPTKLVNQRKQGYLIPLSEDIILQPGGPLQGGFGFRVTNEPILSSGAAVFIMPR
ncbi:uncharacterized protein N7446_007575 [Penicillium canescens]|uniref:uncharacterized protein n=1 Tax=Penicillium canescens TaxID=5083 RepID=UPI0026DEF748|nr:uncharacterized protein N7446_007575 [Penicillium canescens]KAJ6047296.1 hypothetical protein N7444_007098 [Penicillium canescens]KAJ6063455.1 hypothetical protein N7446_007575 [Penicillium canescens]